jgi:hypothetical protein
MLKICMPMIVILLMCIKLVRSQLIVSFINLMFIYLKKINFVCLIVLCVNKLWVYFPKFAMLVKVLVCKLDIKKNYLSVFVILMKFVFIFIVEKINII